jgi:hypothetical protein
LYSTWRSFKSLPAAVTCPCHHTTVQVGHRTTFQTPESELFLEMTLATGTWQKWVAPVPEPGPAGALRFPHCPLWTPKVTWLYSVLKTCCPPPWRLCGLCKGSKVPGLVSCPRGGVMDYRLAHHQLDTATFVSPEQLANDTMVRKYTITSLLTP